MATDRNEDAILELVLKAVAVELPPGSPMPEASVDLVKLELLDSMGWVGVLSAMEKALGVHDFANAWPEGKPQSIAVLVELAVEASTKAESLADSLSDHPTAGISRAVAITGWGRALGSTKTDAAQIEAQYALPTGTITDRAGVGSVCRASDAEDELSLAQEAATRALETADLDPGEVELLIGVSTTFQELPSFAAALHSRLLLPQHSAALDVGGACVGFVNALATAKNFVANGNRRTALVVASEVHSRKLASSREAGEFRGLFGDGACALLLRASDDCKPGAPPFRIGESVSGCTGSMSSALHLSLHSNGTIQVDFEGETLGRGAVATLDDVITKLERLSGVSRSDVESFAFHEPNPRLAVILAQRADVPLEKFTRTAETTGNLGSVTCGVNLCAALTRARETHRQDRRHIIFVAAVGPGVLWSGTYVQTPNERD